MVHDADIIAEGFVRGTVLPKEEPVPGACVTTFLLDALRKAAAIGDKLAAHSLHSRFFRHEWLCFERKRLCGGKAALAIARSLRYSKHPAG